MAAKNYSSTRYSGLAEINTENAKDLKVAWTFATGTNRGQEAAPIMANNTMYVVTPYPNILFAFDLTKGGALKWKYEPKPAPASQGVACCDVVNAELHMAPLVVKGKVLVGNSGGEMGVRGWLTALECLLASRVAFLRGAPCETCEIFVATRLPSRMHS